MKYFAVLVSATLTLAGCATTPMAPSSASSVPPERVVAFQEPIAGPSGTLIVTRDKGFLGGGCYYGFYINDVLAARMDNSETAKFAVVPGELVLRAGRDPQGRALCGMGQQEWTQRETLLRDGETKYFRLSIDANGKTDIQRADPAGAP
ncbi:MAG: hypothetical protein ACYCOU_07935 [Sulfobacillus sp.]